MNLPIISLQHWLGTAPGRYLLAWEQAQLDLAVANLFGFNALQLGLPELQALRANRMPHRWVALPEEALPWSLPTEGLFTGEGRHTVDVHPDVAQPLDATAEDAAAHPAMHLPRVALVTDAAALPFPAASLDLVVLPHTLELSADPHQVLREVERVLVPEGSVVISGFNPFSLWGIRRLLARSGASEPWSGHFRSMMRIRDWLTLLGFEVQGNGFGCYAPPVGTPRWLERWRFLDRAGARWWPVLGASYLLHGVKRVQGMRLITPYWRSRKATSKRLSPVAQRDGGTRKTQ